jgi:hypothetical protein
VKPFLRPATDFGAVAKPVPSGWQSQAIGTWRGRAVEVIYDPRAYDVAFVRGSAPKITAAMANTGWTRCGRDGRHEWWIRDRVEAATSRLRSFERRSTAGLAVVR